MFATLYQKVSRVMSQLANKSNANFQNLRFTCTNTHTYTYTHTHTKILRQDKPEGECLVEEDDHSEEECDECGSERWSMPSWQKHTY